MKRTLKRLLALCLTCLMLAALTVPAAADVIWEPNDLFYKTHANECEYIRYRRYLTNSDTGYVYQYQSPASSVTTASHPNGTEIALAWLYTDGNGETWGLPSDESGWVKLSELSLIYDCQEFVREHESELVPFADGSFEPIVSTDEKPVLSWTYPGGEKSHTLPVGEDITEYVHSTYTAEDGKLWGYIIYMYGMRDFWVCLSAPFDESAGGYAVTEHEIALKQEPVPVEDIPVPAGNITAWILAGVLIVAVVVGTGVLIRVMYAKKKKS